MTVGDPIIIETLATCTGGNEKNGMQLRTAFACALAGKSVELTDCIRPCNQSLKQKA
jgi:hypothetical protein